MAQRLWKHWEISLKRRFILLATSYLDRPHGSRCHWLHWAPLTRVKGIKSQKRKDHSWALLESVIDFFSLKVSWEKYFRCHRLHNLSPRFCNFAFFEIHVSRWRTAERVVHSDQWVTQQRNSTILKVRTVFSFSTYFYSQSIRNIFILEVTAVFSFPNFFPVKVRARAVFRFPN